MSGMHVVYGSGGGTPEQQPMYYPLFVGQGVPYEGVWDPRNEADVAEIVVRENLTIGPPYGSRLYDGMILKFWMMQVDGGGFTYTWSDEYEWPDQIPKASVPTDENNGIEITIERHQNSNKWRVIGLLTGFTGFAG